MALLSIKRKTPSPNAPVDPVYDLDVPQGEVRIHDSAAKRIVQLQEQLKQPILRVGIKGGGCSGLSFHFAMEDQPKATDAVFEHAGAKICVDPKSLQLIGSSLLVWQESLTRSQFALLNKDPKKSCSCGQSFSV